MTTPHQHNADSEGGDLSDQAIDWLARLHSGAAVPADRAAFAAWRASSPAHAAAACEAEALWSDLGATRTATTFRHDAGVLPFKAPERPKPGPIRRRVVLAGALAASLAVVVAGSGVLGPVAGLFADHSTGIGDQRRVALPDGSIAVLNTATALSVRFAEGERRVVLHAGEIFLEVAKDADRPFLVEAGRGEARAVGTVYAVRRQGDAVGVTVAEGVVEVGLAGSDAPVRLTVGQHATYGAHRPPTQASTVDAGAETAWRRGKLIFNRRPLGEVVAELERYRHGRILVTGEDLRRLQVTGVFDLAQSNDLLRAIEQSLPVKVVRLPLLTVIH